MYRNFIPDILVLKYFKPLTISILFTYKNGLRKPFVTLNSMLTVVLRNKIACFIHKDNSSLNYATDRNE